MELFEIKDVQLKSEACKNITAQLPEWFGIPEANEKYISDAGKYPAIAAKVQDNIVGLLVYKAVRCDIKNINVIDIHWLGVMPDFHGHKIGSALINFLVDKITHHVLTVETLDPDVEDEFYLKTFQFYKSQGFNIYHRFEYENGSKMVKMDKTICNSPPQD